MHYKIQTKYRMYEIKPWQAAKIQEAKDKKQFEELK